MERFRERDRRDGRVSRRPGRHPDDRHRLRRCAEEAEAGERGEPPQNAPVSAALAIRPAGFTYVRTAPVTVSVTVSVNSAFVSDP